MAKSAKPVRPSRSKRPPKPVVVEAPTEPAPDTTEETASRYTWEEIRAKVKPASPSELAVYAVTAADADLVALGAQLRSERILTDLRTWVGQILDWRSRAKAAPFGFSDARLRVIVHHAFALQDLLDRSSARSRARIEHAQAVALADKAYRDAQSERRLLRAVLDQASSRLAGFAEKVAAADAPAHDPAPLMKTIESMVKIAREEIAAQSPIGLVLVADGVTDASLSRFTAAVETLRKTHDATRGAAAVGPVAQADIDRQDGVCLTLMDGLRGLFRELREADRTAPALIPRATGRVFGNRSRKRDDDTVASGDPPKEG